MTWEVSELLQHIIRVLGSDILRESREGTAHLLIISYPARGCLVEELEERGNAGRFIQESFHPASLHGVSGAKLPHTRL